MDKSTQDIIDAGNDILKSVSRAIDTNDYSKLASEITQTVKAVSIDRHTTYASGARTVDQSYRSSGSNYNNAQKLKPFPFLKKNVSRYHGLFSVIFGGVTEFFALMVFIASFFTPYTPFIVTMAAICLILALWIISGARKLRLSKKFYEYGNILKNAEYFAISDLAKASVKSDKEVLNDIKAMMKAGYLPRARLDAAETTCMITDAAYQMYLGAEQDRLARETRQAQEEKVISKNTSEDSSVPSNVQQLLADGNDYIRFVRDINDIIPDTEEMSNKLYRLESIMNRIFEQVKKEPSSADELHKLMNYYLPTTKKLLSAYVELDKQDTVGENIQQTKKEIDTAMDTINLAFENLLDSLFQDMAWDISSDISVMKTMMAQDGLTEGGMAMATATAGATASAAQQQEL